MNFTFGIVTNGKEYAYLNNCIESIHNQKIRNYEIIIVGNVDKNKIFNKNKINFIHFDENIKPGWITRKKNIITKESTYENIVYMHDYLTLDKKWYKGFTRFGDDYEIAMNKILNPDKSRYRDWTLWPHNDCFVDEIINDNACLIPYSVSNLSEYMYISGAYWVAKKQIMEKFPLNEELTWGEGEDVEWSKRVRGTYMFKLNKYSKIKLQKYKNPQFKKISRKQLKKIHENI